MNLEVETNRKKVQNRKLGAQLQHEKERIAAITKDNQIMKSQMQDIRGELDQNRTKYISGAWKKNNKTARNHE